MILASGLAASTAAGQSETTIRLLSDEAADACIAEAECLRDLFLQATLGGEDEPGRRVFKWASPTRAASFTGDRVSGDVPARVAAVLGEISLLGKAAGVDVRPADGDDVVNLMLLISDDFAADRDSAFAELFTTVFAGRLELYDQLIAGGGPVCSSRGFVEGEAGIAGGIALAETAADGGRLERCLFRSMLEVLGLQYPLSGTTDSVLNPASERRSWTSVDFVLLKLLYDSQVKPGMGREDLTAIFPRVYEATLRSSS
jgi:hypothetical protein